MGPLLLAHLQLSISATINSSICRFPWTLAPLYFFIAVAYLIDFTSGDVEGTRYGLGWKGFKTTSKVGILGERNENPLLGQLL